MPDRPDQAVEGALEDQRTSRAAAAIDKALTTGAASTRDVAARFGISKSAVSRHAQHVSHAPRVPVMTRPPARRVPANGTTAAVAGAPAGAGAAGAGASGTPASSAAPASEAPAPAPDERPDDSDEPNPEASGWSHGELGRAQEHAVLLLAAGAKVAQVAAETGRHRNTVYAWLADETFAKHLRRTMEGHRRQLESRVFALADDAAVVAQRFLRSEDFERQAVGIKVALASAVRLASRYKELQIEGFVPSPAPLVIFPADFTPGFLRDPIEVRALPVATEPEGAASEESGETIE